MNIVFIMDPLTTVNYEKDTSFAFMLESQRRGHDVFYVPNEGVSSVADTIVFKATRVTPQNDPHDLFEIHETQYLNEHDIDVVFIRTDPPFNDLYLTNTWLLDQANDNIVLVNNPAGIRRVNEKIWATQFKDVVPKTTVSSDQDVLLDFLKDIIDGVAKPIDGFGGQSVFKVKHGDSNAIVAMETLTERWRKKIILQEFVKESVEGDKRVLLLNGKTLGAVLRIHGDHDHRNNFFAGGRAEPTDITEKEQAIIHHLSPLLVDHGLYFVGLDFMGEKLIEVNVTSPTCLQEMNRLYGKNLAAEVVGFAESRVQTS